jgi:hypothetical protein
MNVEIILLREETVSVLKETFRFFLPAIAILAVASASLACEFQFELTFPDGSVQSITPDREVDLKLGEQYALEVRFIPDHRRCETPPEATRYVLQEEKWKAGKDYLPLGLLSMSSWNESAESRSGAWEQELRFAALIEGNWALEILRECTKGGYDESLHFQVR